jgi:HPt (histidine-containing phosphotransfer) domain-containing protein
VTDAAREREVDQNRAAPGSEQADRTSVEAALHDLETDLGIKSVRRLCSIFLDDTELRMNRLADAVGARDAVSIRALAHTVRGSLSNLRARYAMETSMALEHEGDSSWHRHHYGRLVHEVALVQSVVRNYLDR